MSATLGELAERFDCRLRGRAERSVERVAPLATADASSVSFLVNPLYRSALRETAAAAVVLTAQDEPECPVDCLVTDNPYATYARIASALAPARPIVAGIHPSAQIASSAEVSDTAEIGPLVVVGERARIGAHALIGAGSILESGVQVGADSRVHPRVTLLHDVSVGARCILHSGVVVGADGFGFALDQGEWVKVPQTGTVVIGDDVEIGANTTVDRGTMEATVIEDGVKLDNLVQIAHNVRVGAHSIMAAMSGAAGSTRIGKRCMIGGGAVMIDHLEICDDVLITFRSVVTKSIHAPGTYSGSLPAAEAAQWRRNAARFRSLDRLGRRLSAAESEIHELKTSWTRKT